MRDIPIRSREEVLDPIGKRFWPFMKGRDGCRSPMQWEPGAQRRFHHAGAKPWLPVHPNASRRNVEAQHADPRSLLNFYRRLIALRRAIPGADRRYVPAGYLWHALYPGLPAPDQRPDRAGRAQFFTPPPAPGARQSPFAGGLRLLLSTHRETLPSAARGALLALEPYEAMILEIK